MADMQQAQAGAGMPPPRLVGTPIGIAWYGNPIARDGVQLSITPRAAREPRVDICLYPPMYCIYPCTGTETEYVYTCAARGSN